MKYRSTVNETLRVTLNENASNFESFNGDKHHIPDAVYEINSQFFSYFFFQYLWFLAVEIKRDYKDYPVKLVHGKAPKFVREVWNFRIWTTCARSKIKIQTKDSLGLEFIRITQFKLKLAISNKILFTIYLLFSSVACHSKTMLKKIEQTSRRKTSNPEKDESESLLV